MYFIGAFADQPESGEPCVMDWNRVEGNWKHSKVEPKRSGIGSQTTIWMSAMVDKTSSRGKIQERYGIQKDQAKKDIETWFKSLP
jgi:hypothetical protein